MRQQALKKMNIRHEKKSQPGMTTVESLRSRPPLERMLRIHQALQSGKFPNASTLAREIEVATKTIHRDIEFMRDRLGLPVEFEPGKNGYAYTEEVSAFPNIQITEGEIFALIVAEKALQQIAARASRNRFSAPSGKSGDAARHHIAQSRRHRADDFLPHPRRADLNLEIFDTLARAAARQQIELAYRKPGQPQPEKRLVDPYHLANINGEWYLFAYDHARKDIRTFVPARVQSAKPTGQTFERPQKFSLEKRLRDSFGAHSGEGEYEVVIRFTRAPPITSAKRNGTNRSNSAN